MYHITNSTSLLVFNDSPDIAVHLATKLQYGRSLKWKNKAIWITTNKDTSQIQSIFRKHWLYKMMNFMLMEYDVELDKTR